MPSYIQWDDLHAYNQGHAKYSTGLGSQRPFPKVMQEVCGTAKAESNSFELHSSCRMRYYLPQVKGSFSSNNAFSHLSNLLIQ